MVFKYMLTFLPLNTALDLGKVKIIIKKSIEQISYFEYG